MSSGYFSWNNSIPEQVFQQITNCLRQEVSRTDDGHGAQQMKHFQERALISLGRNPASCRDQYDERDVGRIRIEVDAMCLG